MKTDLLLQLTAGAMERHGDENLRHAESMGDFGIRPTLDEAQHENFG